MEGNLNMKGENVLIIDGEEHYRNLLSQLMAQVGYKFSMAAEPSKALGDLRNEPFTLVIAEVSLFHEQKILKIQDLNLDTCFIFTGHSIERFRDHIKPGVSDFLFKPFGFEEAESRLRRIILERDTRFEYEKAEKALQAVTDELERKNRQLELSMEDLEHIKHLYKEIGNELTTTSEKLRRANDRLEVLAITDGLTEVYNHRYFMEHIHDKFEDAKKQSTPLSLLMIDIDHFKAFNDIHGHMTGDLVLKKIAHILKSSCRREDIVARYGGEEFAIILPETDSHRAKTVAEKIRTTVENHRTPNGKEARRVTVSIGIGTRGGDIDSVDDLISSSDRALYRAKAAGRNQVVFCEKDEPIPYEQWYSRF